ncbi:exported hypothetical protein [Nitrosopumilaceae archaeon]|nr:hypothetical protein [Nitrosopumilus sp.]CAI9832626.1 exported hypothetical protein [Nitrosopumilaceae archaeon]MDA7942196.1 hypothetical protein [Nitrosopumilus sp.]MDA7943511.1 hypothetical protein [Nitrosopumilus sp.]MDA7944940.1 hypothetical protein [Nitrosopumilus sp.]
MKMAMPVAGLLLALAVAPTVALVQADNGTYATSVDEAMETGITAIDQIEELSRQALASGEIPISEMPARTGDSWQWEYGSMAEFRANDAFTRSFINTHLEGHEWNRVNAEHHLRIYNFETITGAVGHGHEMALLVSELKKLQDRYDASEPVEKFHAWLGAKYTTPVSEQGIIDRLAEITGDEKFLGLAEKAAESFDKLVENGIPPSDIFNSDYEYWLQISHDYMCGFVQWCDSGSFGNAAVIGAVKTDAVRWDVWDYFLPEASAQSKVYVPYNLVLYIFITSCELNYKMCSITEIKKIRGGQGEFEIPELTNTDDHPVIGAFAHTTGGTLTVGGSACVERSPSGKYPGIITDVRVVPISDRTYQYGSSAGDAQRDKKCSSAIAIHEIPTGRNTPFGGKASSTGPYYLR